MWKRLNSNQMCEQFSYKEVSYKEVLLYIYIYIYINIYTIKICQAIAICYSI